MLPLPVSDSAALVSKHHLIVQACGMHPGYFGRDQNGYCIEAMKRSAGELHTKGTQPRFCELRG